MHDSAREFGQRFFDVYGLDRAPLSIAELGAADVNGSLRGIVPDGCEYLGLDLEEGPGVDRRMEDPYRLPVEDATLDMCLATSCLEHVEFFWLLFEDMLRAVKPDGLVYLNVPSSGPFHRFPVDCWRFYPDSGVALEKWGRRQGYDCLMLESFTDARPVEGFRDFVCVFVKDRAHAGAYPGRISDDFRDYGNGLRDDRRTLDKADDLANSDDQRESFREAIKEELIRQWKAGKT